MKNAPVIFSFLLLCFSPTSDFAQHSLTQQNITDLHVSGLFAQALNASSEGRLKNFITGPESRAIRIYDTDSAKSSKSQGWDGECAGKWLYATAKAVERSNDEELRHHLKAVADFLVSQQDTDGYLGTYNDTMRFTGNPVNPKETFDLWMNGYIMQGLMETYRVLNDQKYLAAVEKIARLCIRTFNDGKKNIAYAGGWHGMASACVLEHFADLYIITHKQEFLEFAYYCLRALENRPDAKFVTKMLGADDVSQIASGKMYEMLHCLVGIAKLYTITKDSSLQVICTSAWKKIKEHINAAGGPAGGVTVFLECYDPRSFFSPYQYSETCAMMDWFRFNKVMLLATGKARYADELENTAYNAMLGAAFKDGYGWAYHSILNGRKDRTDPFACCSSSGTVVLEEVPDAIYSAEKNEIKINLLMASSARMQLPATSVNIKQETTYPFNGSIKVHVDPEKQCLFTLYLRIPEWASNAAVLVNGAKTKVRAGDYVKLTRPWKNGDLITLSLPMMLRTKTKHAIDSASKGQDYTAIYKGPLLFATKWLDSKEHPQPLIATNTNIANAKLEAELPYPIVSLNTQKGKINMVPYALVNDSNENDYHAVWIKVSNN